MTQLVFNAKEATHFLNKFNYQKTTLQLLIPEGKPNPVASGKILWNGQKGSSTVVFEDKPFDLQIPILRDIYILQQQNLGIFFMVNEGDGEIHAPAVTPRSSESVKILKSCFVDTDKGNIKNLENFCRAKGVQAHLVVQSSPKRYHVYFLIEETAKSPQALFQWESIQQKFMSLDPLFDQSMNDCAKLLRVPGFYHTKRTPILIKLVRENTHPPYSLEDLYNRVDAQSTPPSKGKQFIRPIEGTLVPESSRHATLNSYLSSLSNKTYSKDELIDLSIGFATRSFEDGKQWLSDGSRHTELLSQVQTYINYREEEEKKHSIQVAMQLLDTQDFNSLNSAKDSGANRSKDTSNNSVVPIDYFKLPDEFYFECPGIVGPIVKNISKNAMYPVPAFAFAATIGAIGTLKSPSIETSLGHSPANYMMCFGPTGVGKGYAQDVLSATLYSLGLSKLINTKIRSSNGILRFLEDNNNIGLIMMDEAETFFSMLENSKSEGYIRQCKDILLTLYSSTRRSDTYGYVGNKKEKPIQLVKPCLSLVSHGVLHTLEKSFSKKAIADGFLQRFVVLTASHDRVFNENYKPAVALNGELIEAVKDITRTSGLLMEESMDLINDLTEEIDVCTNREQKKLLKKKLADLQTRPEGKRVAVKFDSDALTSYNLFARDLDRLVNSEVRKATGLEGLYTRGGEQIGRLAAVIASPEEGISKDMVEYLITFVKSRIEALKAYCEESLGESTVGGKTGYTPPDIEGDYKKLRSFIAEKIKESGGCSVTWRDIVRKFSKKSDRYLNELVERGINLEEIRELEKQRAGDTKGKKGRHFLLQNDF